MDLKNFTKHLIYQSANTQIPDNFSRFQILHPEYSAHESVVKTYPLPENEHLFSLLWDIHDGHMLSATILPSQPSFLYEKEFTPGMRTQMHSHEYLELFLSLDRKGNVSFVMKRLLWKNSVFTRIGSLI